MADDEQSNAAPAVAKSLGARAATGVAWTVALTLLARVASMIVNILVTRFITPTDYGEVQGAVVLTGTAGALSSFGLGAYLVAHPKEDRETTWHVTAITLGTCALLLGALFFVHGPMGRFFHLVGFERFLPLLGASVLMERAGMPMEKLLLRQLRYRPLGIISGAAEASYAVATGTIVMLGYGAVGLAIASLVRAMVKFLAYSLLVDRREWLTPSRLEWTRIRRMMKFGLPLSLAGVADYISHRWDNMLTSRYFGAALMGSYNIAYNLADIPNEIIGERAGDALLPAFSQLDEEDRFAGLVRALKLLALILFPLSLGLAAVAETAVRAIFDPRWAPVAPMLSILCGISLSRPLTYATAVYLQSLSQTYLLPVFEVTKTVMVLSLMAVLGPMGPLWACAAATLSFTLHSLIMLSYVGRRSESLGALVLAPLPALIACVPMVGAVLGVRWLFPQTGLGNAWLQLVCEILVGGLVGVGAAFVFARPIAMDLWGLVQKVLRRGKK